MAIEVYSKREKLYGILSQAAWGTPAADGSGVQQIECPGLTIDPDVKIRESEQSHGSIRPIDPELIADTKRSAPTISIPEVAAKQDLLDYFLHLLFHTVTEAAGGTSGFKKTFTLPTTRPDLSANGGFFATLFERFPSASNSRSVADCIARSLRLVAAPGERLNMSSELAGRGSVTENANPSATWTRPADQFWYWEDIDLATANSVNLRMQGYELNFESNPEPYGNDGSGNFETFAPFHPFRGTFRMTVGENVTSTIRQLFMTAWKAGTLWPYVIQYNGTGESDGDLKISFNGKITKVTPMIEEILAFDVEGVILTSAISASPVTIILNNNIDRSW